jgi:2-phosphosulfolactate phosphatase
MPFRPVYVGIAECEQARGTAVVIDVLRAFTTAAWALHLGVERIVLTSEIDEALRIKSMLPGALAMKDSKPMVSFELSNSPVELQAADGLARRTIVQRTTHGTVGAWAARAASSLYCASFLVAAATARAIREARAPEVYFVVTGEGGTAEEDKACAEYIAALVEDPDVDAAPYLRRARGSNVAAMLAQRAMDGVPGVHKEDVEACLEADRFDFAMRVSQEEGLLVLRPYNLLSG